MLEADPDNAQAYLVKTRIELHQQRAHEAIDSALAAIGLQYGKRFVSFRSANSPPAYLHLNRNINKTNGETWG